MSLKAKGKNPVMVQEMEGADHWKESDRKDDVKNQDSWSVPEPKKPKENPASSFSSAGNYVALSIMVKMEPREKFTLTSTPSAFS